MTWFEGVTYESILLPDTGTRGSGSIAINLLSLFGLEFGGCDKDGG